MRSTKWISKIAIGLFLGTLTLSGCSSTDPSTVSEGSNSGSIDSTAIDETRPSRPLTVAYWNAAPGAYLNSEGELVGWEIELIQRVSRELETEVEFIQMDFADILPAVISGEVDLGVGSIFSTPERQVYVDFVNYGQGGVSWATLTDRVESPFDPCGWRVAGEIDTTNVNVSLPNASIDCRAAGKEPITIVPVQDLPVAVNLLQREEIDAFIGDSPTVTYIIQESGGRIAQTGVTQEVQSYGIAVNKNDRELSQSLVDALTSWSASGDYNRLLGKWAVSDSEVSFFTINQLNPNDAESQ